MWNKLQYINLYLKRAPKKILKSKKNRSQNNLPENNVVPVPAKSHIICCPFGGNWLHIIFQQIVLETTAQLEKCSSSPSVASVWDFLLSYPIIVGFLVSYHPKHKNVGFFHTSHLLPKTQVLSSSSMQIAKSKIRFDY